MFCSKLKIKLPRCSFVNRTAWISTDLHIIHCNKDSWVSSPDVTNSNPLWSNSLLEKLAHRYTFSSSRDVSILTWQSPCQMNIPLETPSWACHVMFYQLRLFFTHAFDKHFKWGSQRNSANLVAEVLKPHTWMIYLFNKINHTGH